MEPQEIYKDIEQAGTGFMHALPETLKKLQSQGYTANLTPMQDHFECELGEVSLYPDDFTVDKIVRFDNTSDPDDQSILYAISAKKGGIKGVYIESYGPQSVDLSAKMLEALKDHPH